MKVLTIGDLHLRSFWKDAVKDWDGPIIFLGDYVDPYPHEWGKQMPDPAYYLLEVISFKECNPDRVTLLLGNHDYHYLFKGYNGSRLDVKNWDTLHKIYNENKEYFQIAKQFDGTLFTHAGVSTAWLKRRNFTLPKKDADVFLNEIYNITPEIFWEISFERGGWLITGSPIWHDLREFDCDDTLFQIFGHTYLRQNPVRLDNFACVDCRRAFIINTITHEIHECNTTNL